MYRDILALGNTASVMATISAYVPRMRVGCAPVPNSEVIQENDRCFRIPGVNVSSISWVRFIREACAPNTNVHAELQYSPACLRAGTQYGVHVHGTTDAELLYPRTRLGAVLKSPFRVALEHANYVLSHPMLLRAVSQIRPDVLEFPSPVETSQFSPGGDSVRMGDKICFLSPSRIDQWKGHAVIWEALRIMGHRERVQVFQSDWGWEPSYSRLRKGAPASVEFIRVIPRKRIANYYRGADVVIGQMQLGHLGLAELEAAACGVPTTVFSKDAHSPFLPKHSDPVELAAVWDRIIEDHAFRQNYVSECRKYVMEHHNAERLASRFQRIVDESPKKGGRSLQARDIFPLELGTGLECVERILGGPSGFVRARLLGL